MEIFASHLLTSLAQRFALIVGELRLVVGNCVGRHRAGLNWYFLDPAIVPLVGPIQVRLQRMKLRFERLMARLAAGWRPGLVVPRERKRPEVARTRAVGAVRFPTRFGWLVGLTQEAAVYGVCLQELLDAPEMRAVVAEVPAVQRLLRPFCHALGVRPGPPLGKVVDPARVVLNFPRDRLGRFVRAVVKGPRFPRHWIEPYPGSDIRFLVE